MAETNVAQWIIFDVGDVLLDWQGSSKALAADLGVDYDALLDAVFAYADDMFVGKLSPDEGWNGILARLGIEADPWEMVLRWRGREHWFEPSLALVRDLHEQGYNLAIMSNSWLGLTDPRDAGTLPEELRLFSHIFDSSQAGMKKPDPRFYDLLQQRLGASGSDLMLIDDTLKNAAPAEERGWRFYQYLVADDKGAAAAAGVREVLS